MLSVAILAIGLKNGFYSTIGAICFLAGSLSVFFRVKSKGAQLCLSMASGLFVVLVAIAFAEIRLIWSVSSSARIVRNTFEDGPTNELLIYPIVYAIIYGPIGAAIGLLGGGVAGHSTGPSVGASHEWCCRLGLSRFTQMSYRFAPVVFEARFLASSFSCIGLVAASQPEVQIDQGDCLPRIDLSP
jgi:hypothetical protein